MNKEVNIANKWHCSSIQQLGNDKAIFQVKNHQHQSKIEPWGITLINDCLQSNFILLAQKITRNSWNLDLTLADGVFGRMPPFEEGYCEEYITDILPIHHWQTTDILPTADRKVAIDTSTDIQCVVIASIDRHSIECQRKLKVCRPRCRACVNRGSTEGRPRCRSSVDRGLIEVSIAGIDRHLIAGVNSTHDPSTVLFLSWAVESFFVGLWREQLSHCSSGW